MKLGQIVQFKKYYCPAYRYKNLKTISRILDYRVTSETISAMIIGKCWKFGGEMNNEDGFINEYTRHFYECRTSLKDRKIYLVKEEDIIERSDEINEII